MPRRTQRLRHGKCHEALASFRPGGRTDPGQEAPAEAVGVRHALPPQGPPHPGRLGDCGSERLRAAPGSHGSKAQGGI